MPPTDVTKTEFFPDIVKKVLFDAEDLIVEKESNPSQGTFGENADPIIIVNDALEFYAEYSL